MPNVHVSGAFHTRYIGTVTSGGTLSNTIDLADFTLAGLFAPSGATAGTITVQAAEKDPLGTLTDFVTITDADNEDVQIKHGTSFAVSGDALRFIAPYRYIRLKFSTAQTSGLMLYIPVSA